MKKIILSPSKKFFNFEKYFAFSIIKIEIINIKSHKSISKNYAKETNFLSFNFHSEMNLSLFIHINLP